MMKFSDQQTRVNFLPIARARLWEQHNCSFGSCTEDYVVGSQQIYFFFFNKIFATIQDTCCYVAIHAVNAASWQPD